jgi:hypothetical protein
MNSTARILLLALLLVSVSVGGAARADAVSPTSWTGKFAYVGGSSQQEAIRRAIEAATSDMGPLTRRIARSRLAAETRPDPNLRIEVDGHSVGVLAQSMWRSPLDGSVRVVRDSDGDAFRVSQHIEGRRLYQVIRDDSVVIRNVFALSPDGKALAIRVSLEHQRVPQPLAYELTYRRLD